MRKIGINRNVLKIIACISMFIDHFGYFIYPRIMVFRIVGRISFPLFAYFISEGAKYTKNKLRYFLNIALIGCFFQIIYLNFTHSYLMNEFIDYAIAIGLIYIIQFFKKSLFNKQFLNSILSFILFCLVTGGIFYLYFSKTIRFEYKLAGVMFPVLVSLVDFSMVKNRHWTKYIDNRYTRLILAGFGIYLLTIGANVLQYYGFLALIPLLFYNGEKGQYDLKHFFYIFYPLHLVFFVLIQYLLNH